MQHWTQFWQGRFSEDCDYGIQLHQIVRLVTNHLVSCHQGLCIRAHITDAIGLLPAWTPCKAMQRRCGIVTTWSGVTSVVVWRGNKDYSLGSFVCADEWILGTSSRANEHVVNHLNESILLSKTVQVLQWVTQRMFTSGWLGKCVFNQQNCRNMYSTREGSTREGCWSMASTVEHFFLFFSCASNQ